MREQLPIVVLDRGDMDLYAPESRLGNVDYWKEHFRKTAKDDVETYLGKQSWGQQEEIMRLAKQFHREDKPLSPTASLIPVAAHQESERIIPAMTEFAKQRTDYPFSVLLYLNTPYGSDYGEVQKTLQAVEQAQAAFPDLDIRASDIHEFYTPVIGKIRKNLWDSALYLAHYDGLFDRPGDAIGFNQDIDIEWMSRSLVKNVQKYFQARRARALWAGTDHMKVAGTQLRHAYDHDRPNVSKVVQWRDLVTRVRSANATFEAGMVVPFSTYARSGGIREDDATYETSSLIETEGLAPRIRHTLQTTSPRRFGDRLHDVGLLEVWSDETFGADDVCRTAESRGDISEKRAKKLIKESLDIYVPWFFYQPIIDHAIDRNGDALKQKLKKRKRLAVTVLNRLDRSGELAEYVKQTYKVKKMIAEVENDHAPSLVWNI